MTRWNKTTCSICSDGDTVTQHDEDAHQMICLYEHHLRHDLDMIRVMLAEAEAVGANVTEIQTDFDDRFAGIESSSDLPEDEHFDFSDWSDDIESAIGDAGYHANSIDGTWTIHAPVFDHTYSGYVAICPRGAHLDISEALELDHGGDCPSYCDVTAAMGQSLWYAAAHMLMGSTDCDVVSEVVGWHLEHGTEDAKRSIGTHLYDCADWSRWQAFSEAHGIECDECGSANYDEDARATKCGSCWHDITPDERTARIIAGEWHPGMMSALYSFASSGHVSPKLRDEVEDEVSGEDAVLLVRYLDSIDAPHWCAAHEAAHESDSLACELADEEDALDS